MGGRSALAKPYAAVRNLQLDFTQLIKSAGRRVLIAAPWSFFMR